MRSLFTRSFWGSVLILFGILFLVRNVFGIDIPVGGLFWSLLLIYVGFSMLFRPAGHTTEREVVFDQASFEVKNGGREYSAIFGEGDFDLRKLEAADDGVPVKITSVFGSAIVRIDPDQPVRLTASGVFAGIELPDGRTVSFGERTYTTAGYKEGKPYVSLYLSAVFGSIKLVERA